MSTVAMPLRTYIQVRFLLFQSNDEKPVQFGAEKEFFLDLYTMNWKLFRGFERRIKRKSSRMQMSFLVYVFSYARVMPIPKRGGKRNKCNLMQSAMVCKHCLGTNELLT